MLLWSKVSLFLAGRLGSHCNPQQTSWSYGMAESRVRPSLVEMVLNCLTTLYVYWEDRLKQRTQCLWELWGCLSNYGELEDPKTFVNPAPGVSGLCPVERPFSHLHHVSDGTVASFLPV